MSASAPLPPVPDGFIPAAAGADPSRGWDPHGPRSHPDAPASPPPSSAAPMAPGSSDDEDLLPPDQFISLIHQRAHLFDALTQACSYDQLTPLQIEDALYANQRHSAQTIRSLTRAQRVFAHSDRLTPELADTLSRLVARSHQIESDLTILTHYRQLDALTPAQCQRASARDLTAHLQLLEAQRQFQQETIDGHRWRQHQAEKAARAAERQQEREAKRQRQAEAEWERHFASLSADHLLEEDFLADADSPLDEDDLLGPDPLETAAPRSRARRKTARQRRPSSMPAVTRADPAARPQRQQARRARHDAQDALRQAEQQAQEEEHRLADAEMQTQWAQAQAARATRKRAWLAERAQRKAAKRARRRAQRSQPPTSAEPAIPLASAPGSHLPSMPRSGGSMERRLPLAPAPDSSLPPRAHPAVRRAHRLARQHPRPALPPTPPVRHADRRQPPKRATTTSRPPAPAEPPAPTAAVLAALEQQCSPQSLAATTPIATLATAATPAAAPALPPFQLPPPAHDAGAGDHPPATPGPIPVPPAQELDHSPVTIATATSLSSPTEHQSPARAGPTTRPPSQ
jgi:hypothetical protein